MKLLEESVALESISGKEYDVGFNIWVDELAFMLRDISVTQTVRCRLSLFLVGMELCLTVLATRSWQAY